MGSVFKKAVTRPVPPGAEFVTRKGCGSPGGGTARGSSARPP
jgi:hypothetical protein